MAGIVARRLAAQMVELETFGDGADQCLVNESVRHGATTYAVTFTCWAVVQPAVIQHTYDCIISLRAAVESDR